LIIEKVKLENWQGYYGADHEFRFDGTGGRTSGIIYADNSVGKTAFWEAIEFVMFGRVEISSTTDKPLIAPQSGDRPLLNADAFHEKGNQVFSVELFFQHKGGRYRLLRLYKPRGSTKAKIGRDMEQKLELENLSASSREDRFTRNVDGWIRDNILPERLKKFFLFDGQRLEKYQELMESEDLRTDHTLKDDIEDIIRLPVLKHGYKMFDWYRSSAGGSLGVEKAKLAKDKKTRKFLKGLNRDIEQYEQIVKGHDIAMKEMTTRIDELEEWLRINEATRIAATKIDDIRGSIDDKNVATDGFRKDIQRAIKGAWKTILAAKVEEAKAKLQEDLEKQKQTEKKIDSNNRKIIHIERLLKGKKCEQCGAELKKPLASERGKLKSESDDLKEENKTLEEEAKYPSHEHVVRYQKGMEPMKADETNLDYLLSKESDFNSAMRDLARLESNLKDAEEGMATHDHDDVREKAREEKRLREQRGAARSELARDTEHLRLLRKNRDEQDVGTPAERKDLKLRILEKNSILATALCQVFEETLEIYRETARSMTEDAASEIFLSISNNAKYYKKLRINPDFSVDIINKKRGGERDAGSQAQSIVMAYSLLDALGRSSDYEFPMIIDTPGRGMATKNLAGVWQHLTTSSRQVIALPYDKELDPTEGDKKYSKNLAATYELEKVDNDRTVIRKRVTKNLEQ